MLRCLSNRADLKRRAEILLQVLEIGPQLNNICEKIQYWGFVAKLTHENQFLIDLAQITLQVSSLIGFGSKAFELASMPRLFDIKSTRNKEKCMYFFVLKQYLALNGVKGTSLQKWGTIPHRIIPEDLVGLIKTLAPPNKLTVEMAQIQDIKEGILSYAEQLHEDDS